MHGSVQGMHPFTSEIERIHILKQVIINIDKYDRTLDLKAHVSPMSHRSTLSLETSKYIVGFSLPHLRNKSWNGNALQPYSIDSFSMLCAMFIARFID